MKICIVGDMGFIGTHLKKLYSPDEYVGYDIKNGYDMRDKDELRKVMMGCDTVVHLAALISVNQSWDNQSAYYDNNVVGAACVLEVAKEVGVKKIVYASSAACYDGTSSPYAASKLMGEAVFGIGRGDITIINLRFFNIYGIGQSDAYAGAIKKFIDGANKGTIKITGDGLQTRDFVSVTDVCRAIDLAVKSKLEGIHVMDIGTGKTVSVKELAYIIVGIVGKKCGIEYVPAVKEIKNSCAEVTQAQKAINFVASVNLVDGLIDLISETEKLSKSIPKK